MHTHAHAHIEHIDLQKQTDRRTPTYIHTRTHARTHTMTTTTRRTRTRTRTRTMKTEDLSPLVWVRLPPPWHWPPSPSASGDPVRPVCRTGGPSRCCHRLWPGTAAAAAPYRTRARAHPCCCRRHQHPGQGGLSASPARATQEVGRGEFESVWTGEGVGRGVLLGGRREGTSWFLFGMQINKKSDIRTCKLVWYTGT